MNNNIYVIGHKNPDSDSICSAITYADMLNRLGYSAIPCRQGPLNEETKFILKRFGQENPLLLTDARAMLKDIEMDEPTIVRVDETVHHAWHMMLKTRNRSLCVVDENNKLVGVCTASDLSRVRIHPETDLDQLMSSATLGNIARTIGGQIQYSPSYFSTNGKIYIVALDGKEASIYNMKDSIVITSSGEQKQNMVIDMGAKCLVVTCGQAVSDFVMQKASENKCAVITTQHDTMHTARVITESYAVKEIMSNKVIAFKDSDYVEDVIVRMASTRVRSYPVLDDNDNIVGAFSRYHTRNYQKRKFVLVDHSAMTQVINNIDKAEIVAIIDHHHIGDVTTSKPIEYRNQKCGCTCTIISNLYQENGMLPDKNMCGLLLSAILSDTLNFKSATTTERDKMTARWLADRAGIEDIDAYAREMLGASIALKDATPHEILNRDLKNYEIGQYKIAIGQTNYSRMEDVQAILPPFIKNLEEEQKTKGLDLLVMLFTDVMGEGSYFVFSGPLSKVVSELIESNFDEHTGFDPHIISRKQQMMPKLSAMIQEL